jgi:hypothetical protein
MKAREIINIKIFKNDYYSTYKETVEWISNIYKLLRGRVKEPTLAI